MSRFIIRGQNPLRGVFKPAGNKNAALPMLAASLLTDKPLVLTNVPLIEDVRSMLGLLESVGVQIETRGRTVTLRAGGIRRRSIDPSLCQRVRGSILLAGPLAARHGRAGLFPPGGDIIGRRRLDPHFQGLRALGIHVRTERQYVFERKRLRGAQIVLDEASVTATENIMMAAALARGTTTLFNAACEPHVEDLGRLLIQMGASIQGLGTNRLVVEGVPSLGGARHRVGPDHIEVGSFLAAAAATGGELSVTGAGDETTTQVIERSFRKVGVAWRRKGTDLELPPRKTLRILSDAGGMTPKIEDGVWPSFPSDLMSVALVVATQARGSVLFFEKLFESRMYFVDHLIAMGANIVQCDPHRVVVTGPSRLQGTHLTSPDIRAGMALVIAALCAEGESVIENAQVVDRGYERIEQRLRALGADISRQG